MLDRNSFEMNLKTGQSLKFNYLKKEIKNSKKVFIVSPFRCSNISFEEFNAIRDNLLPWKELPSIIEFYYMWKTSDRCVDQVNIYEKCFILDG